MCRGPSLSGGDSQGPPQGRGLGGLTRKRQHHGHDSLAHLRGEPAQAARQWEVLRPRMLPATYLAGTQGPLFPGGGGWGDWRQGLA